MFKHEKKLLHEVKVDRPNPNYAAMLQEQLGGPQGELKAALQYLSQSMRIKDPEIKDLFLDVAAEELCHMEMVAPQSTCSTAMTWTPPTPPWGTWRPTSSPG